MLSSLSGYTSQLWRSFLSTLSYMDSQLTDDSLSNSALQTLVEYCGASFANIRDSIDAYSYYNYWAQEYALLAQAITYDLDLDTDTNTYITNRVTCLQSAALAIKSTYSTTISAASVLSSGSTTVSDPGLVNFLMDFDYETTPTDVATDYPSNFLACALAEATAWATMESAVAAYDNASGDVYNAVARHARITQDVYNVISNLTISSTSDPDTTWNRLVAMQALTRLAALYMADPTSSAAQQSNIARYVICQGFDEMNNLSIKLQQYVPQKLQTYKVKNNDNLPIIAARELGGFERWPEIATINNLQPPYIGSVGAVPQTGLAVPGQTIFLPTSDTDSSASSGGITASLDYELDYLGGDIYLGPLDQQDMSTWTGDFNTQKGYDNLATALGRRLQTPLGALIFHSEYGSRIPPEVGKTYNSTTASNIAAYGKSALLTDPRVASVSNVATTSPKYGEVTLTATATPNGTNTSTSVSSTQSSSGSTTSSSS